MAKKSSTSTTSQIEKLLNKQKLVTFSELQKHGASGTMLKRMTDAGQILAIGSGIYTLPNIDPFVASVWAASKYYPNAVISGLTALQIHGLAQEYVEKVDVDISRETSLKNKLLNVHRVPEIRITGVTKMNYQGEPIRIYDLERTLCEAYHLDPRGPLFFRALKRYVNIGKIKPELIQKYDSAAKTDVLAHLRQEMADD